MWVDLLADEILRTRPEPRHVINDAKSPSGRIHVGSLRGVMLHDCVARALRDRNVPAEFLYGYDDYDPFDAVPVGHEDLAPHLGRPLCDVPSPDPSAAPNFARYYADEFTRVFTRLGATPKIYWGSEMYRSGDFDNAIRIALDHGAKIMELDRAISGSRKAERHPVQIICESCGKIGTTVVTDWDGETVAYECRPDKVTWAKGCGSQGRRAPFGGASKLSYSTEWAAKWRILHVTVEGAGKDHMTRGGSWDRAAAIAEGIYAYPRPFAIPYEWILVGGRKMASSKGIGTPAAEFAELLRPEMARFAIIRPHYRQAVNFDPGGETIPALYDEFDRAAAAYAGRESDPDLARTFYYANPAPSTEQVFRPRFTHLAHLSQIPSADIASEVAREKGAPLTDADRAELELRLADVRKWLEAYAPPAHRFEVQAALPDAVRDLSEAQRRFLAALAPLVERASSGEELHAQIHALKGEHNLTPKAAFSAIYLAFLGKESGPQGGWFLAALDRSFAAQRLREAAAAAPVRNADVRSDVSP